MNNERSCDKLLVKNNSRKHFVVFCALIEAKGTDIKMIKEELLITHHGRTLHGYFFKPEEKGCFPLVIMSHGYNGCKDDFEKTIFGTHLVENQTTKNKIRLLNKYWQTNAQTPIRFRASTIANTPLKKVERKLAFANDLKEKEAIKWLI